MEADFERARRAIAFLEGHQLSPSVANYDLALSYVTNPASDLAREIDSQTDSGLRLTHEAAAAIANRYLRRSPNVPVDEWERSVARHTDELSTLTGDAHDLTSALGREVGTMIAQTDEWPKTRSDFIGRLSVTERELADLRSAVADLQSQIGNGGHLGGDSDHDDLTEALSQKGAQQSFEELADYDHDYVVILFSLDDLIGLNVRFGRAVGDNILKALAATLRQTFPEQKLIRWSGNEFVIVTRDTTLTTARILADEALTAFKARRLKLRGSGEWIGVVTASAGIGTGRREAGTVVLERVRANALSAKASGGNRLEG
jgi:diguanylate cyclase